MKLQCKNIPTMIMEAEGISFEEACEHPIYKKLNEIMFKYVGNKITEAFGDTFIMGSSNGGLMLEIDIDNVIDVGDDGDKEEYMELP